MSGEASWAAGPSLRYGPWMALPPAAPSRQWRWTGAALRASRRRLAVVSLAVPFFLPFAVRPAAAEAGRSPAIEVVRSGGAPCTAVALTFDLCPVRDPVGFDAPLVGFLRESHTPATFFASGRWMERHEDRTREILAAAPQFELATHGARHAHLRRLADDQQREEIEGGLRVARERFTATPTLFRPPYGEFDDRAVRAAADLGQRFVLWSVVSGDPTPGATPRQILGAVTSSLRGGAIVVFHANGKGAHTREVIETLVRDELPRRGLEPVTVTELLRRCPAAGPAGGPRSGDARKSGEGRS